MKEIDKLQRTRELFVFSLDLIIFHFSFVLSFLFRYRFTLPTFNYRAYQNIILYIMVFFILLNLLSGVYIFYNKKKTDILYSTLINQGLMAIIVTVLVFFTDSLAFPRTVIVINMFISTILLSVSRMIIYNLYEKISGRSKVMVVGSEEDCKKAVWNFQGARSEIYKITDIVHDNYYDNIEKKLENIDVVYLTNTITGLERKDILSLLVKKEKKIFMSTKFENLLLLNSSTMNIEDETFLELTDFSIPFELGFIKRIIDIIISLFLLVITSPIILITTIIIKVTSPGPILYKQIRITENQREFNILKFRTMDVMAEDKTGPVLSTTNDPRVTVVGKYLRSLRIDELPQLLNVLKGDMSLVGPRPERPHFVDQFNEQNQYYYLRHKVKAGITGYAQVNGKYATDFNSKLNFDLIYIKKYSLILDMQILLQTIKTLFDKVSSQGVDEETDMDNYKIPKHIKKHF